MYNILLDSNLIGGICSKQVQKCQLHNEDRTSDMQEKTPKFWLYVLKNYFSMS